MYFAWVSTLHLACVCVCDTRAFVAFSGVCIGVKTLSISTLFTAVRGPPEHLKVEVYMTSRTTEELFTCTHFIGGCFMIHFRQPAVRIAKTRREKEIDKKEF